MPADVRVRRCTLTVRRRDGWSWGPGPEPYVEAALAGLAAAIESALAEAGVDPELDAVVEAPVRLELDSDRVVTMASWTRLVEQLSELKPPTDDDETDAAEPELEALLAAGEPSPAEVTVAAISRARLGALLARWSSSGQLGRIASSWPAPVLRAWLTALEAAAHAEEEHAPAQPRAAVAEGAIGLIASAVLGEPPSSPGSPHAADERLLVLLGALAATVGGRVPDRPTQAAARAYVAGAGVSETAGESVAESAASATREPPATQRQTGARPLTSGPAELVPALPFLVLAQLARIGYLDAVAAAALACSLPGGGAGLGAALAGKVLPPPKRGWERTAAELGAVAHSAARPPEWVPAGLAAVAANEGALLPPLASALQGAYAEGRSAAEPVLVSRGPHGLVCGEAHGLVPLAWVLTEAELDGVLRSLGDPPAESGDAFLALAEELAPRAGLPRSGAAALERHLGAAAGTALGVLALDVWHDEAATPLMALERLGDLEARVQPTEGALMVRIPRGRRWLDLRAGGLLGLFGVPWMPHGLMEVATW